LLKIPENHKTIPIKNSRDFRDKNDVEIKTIALSAL